MDQVERGELERSVRAACDLGDLSRAVTLAIKGYGPEIYGFLVAVHSNEIEASERFSEVAEGVWGSLPRFAWESSLRTWMYAIARNVLRKERRDPWRRAARAGESAIEDLAVKVRTETSPFLRTENRTRMQSLRDALPEDDRMLLVLRIDRNLAWDELARVLTETDTGVVLDRDAVIKESARLRKRFQIVKERLRELAKKEGLLES